MQPPPPPRDMSAAEFREHGHAVIDWIASYLDDPERMRRAARYQAGQSAAGAAAIPARSCRANGADTSGL